MMTVTHEMQMSRHPKMHLNRAPMGDQKGKAVTMGSYRETTISNCVNKTTAKGKPMPKTLPHPNKGYKWDEQNIGKHSCTEL